MTKQKRNDMKEIDKKKTTEAIKELNKAVSTLYEQCAYDGNLLRTVDKLYDQIFEICYKLRKRGC